MVYAITDRTRFPGSDPERQAALVRDAVRWAADGVDFVQLREKDLEAGELAALARNLLTALATGEPAPKLLINSRADVAIAVAAPGVHLTSAPGELTPAQVRQLYAAAELPPPIISLSCHTIAEVARAASPDPASAPDLILFGPVFEKVTSGKRAAGKETDAEPAQLPFRMSSGLEPAEKGDPNLGALAPGLSLAEATRPSVAKSAAGVGLDLLRAACAAAAPVPVLALGGVTRANAAACLAAGAAGIAAIRLFVASEPM